MYIHFCLFKTSMFICVLINILLTMIITVKKIIYVCRYYVLKVFYFYLLTHYLN